MQVFYKILTMDTFSYSTYSFCEFVDESSLDCSR